MRFSLRHRIVLAVSTLTLIVATPLITSAATDSSPAPGTGRAPATSTAAPPPATGSSRVPASGPATAAPAGQAPVTAFGASINAPDDVRRVSAMLHRPLSTVRVFLSGVPRAWSNNAVLATIPTGGTAAVSFHSGTPAQVTQFLSSRPKTIKCYATYWHEPEDNVKTAAQKAGYRASWHAYAPAIRKAGCKPTLILMKWSLNPKSGRNWMNYYYPTDMDVVAFDAYNTALNRGYYSDPTKYLAPILAASAQVGKPWGLAEVGSFSAGDPSLRAQWAHGVATGSSSDGALFTVWWDHPSFDGKKNFSLDAATAAAWNTNS